MGIQLIQTADGSSSLYNESLNETYHSTHGALQESIHVFLKHGLRMHRSAAPHVLEYGFGTGLNVLLTAIEAASTKRQVCLTTLEAFPLEPEILGRLNYTDIISHERASDWFKQIHACPWETEIMINDFFRLTKVRTPFETWSPNKKFDIIYYDAFAPSKQPELWEREMLSRVVQGMNADGIFVTYCARGQLKRDLASLGLTVETLQGPPGKKEMVRGLKS